MAAAGGAGSTGPAEEDASLLQLGPDFQNVQCLLNSEVAILLQHRMETHQRQDTQLSNVFQQTLNYVQRFSRYKNKDSIKAVRAALSKRDFHEFEIAALANLCPGTAEEAKALIPTLKRVDDDELQNILTDLANLRNFV